MGKHISDSLQAYCHVMSSDEDQPIVMDIYVGFTMHGELAITIDRCDYDEPGCDASTAAIVNIEDAHHMAERHKIKYEDLPCFISENMEEWRDIPNPDFSQVKECFKEITERLLDERCRFEIKRTYGKGGYVCC